MDDDEYSPKNLIDSDHAVLLRPQELCIVIDSRYSSRKKIEQDIRETTLFVSVVEPQSLKDALKDYSRKEPNLCIIGPTVSPMHAKDFLLSARNMPFVGHTCSFIAIGSETSPAISELKALGVDKIIDRTYVLQTLSSSIIETSVQVDPRSPWHDYFESKIKREIESTSNSTAIYQISIDSLRDLSQGIRIGTYGLNLKGQLTLTSREAIAAIVKRALLGHNGQEVEPIYSFLYGTLENWLRECILFSEHQATRKLRNTLSSHNFS